MYNDDVISSNPRNIKKREVSVIKSLVWSFIKYPEATVLSSPVTNILGKRIMKRYSYCYRK